MIDKPFDGLICNLVMLIRYALNEVGQREFLQWAQRVHSKYLNW